MTSRPSLRSVPSDRRSQMDAIRRREDESLVAASRAEVALQGAEDRLAKAIAAHRDAITQARQALGSAYREVVEAFGSQSRAAEYLDVPPGRLKNLLAQTQPATSDKDDNATEPDSATQASGDQTSGVATPETSDPADLHR